MISRTILCVCALSFAFTSDVQGQRPYQSGPAFNIGIYGGGAWPQDWIKGDDFKAMTASGWMTGGMFEVGSRIALRGDAQYIWFGKEKEVATLDVSTRALALTGGLLFDTGQLYVMGGGGWYSFEFKRASGDNTQVRWGANAGAGMPIRFPGLHTFIEAKVHTVFPKKDEDGNATFVTAALGIRFR